MGSSCPNEVFDPIRSLWVKATPEERVRQGFLAYLMGPLGYPRELLAVECEISRLPCLDTPPPPRRIDIVGFYKKGAALRPLLLIECKRSIVEESAWQQLMGYNHFVRAPYIAVVGDGYLRATYEGHPIASLPPYSALKRHDVS